MQYRDVTDRTPDSQYRDLLRRVLDEGEWTPTRQGPRARTLLQQTMRFDLANGFPVIPDRDISSFWHKPIGELCAFVNGVTTLEGLAEFGCDWWDAWASEAKTSKRGLPPGSLGPGSYGGAFHDFPTSEGPGFDQFQHLVEQVVEFPGDRTHFVSPWIPQYQVRGEGKQQRTTISPCHGWVHVRVLNERLHLHMYQRSGDVPVGVPSNMVQYAALLLMLEQLTGFEAAVYHHTISDAHVYEDQVDQVRLLLDREPLRLPTVTLTEAGRRVRDIHDFRGEHFALADYAPHPSVGRWPVDSDVSDVRTTLVVAAARGDVIGRDDDLPWHLPQDLRFFKETTAGGVVVAGRRTHASILARLGRPLPGRTTVVVSSSCVAGPVVHATSPAHGLELAHALAAWAGQEEVFVIGGAQLYAAVLPDVDRVHLTRIDADVAGDTAMPPGWLDGLTLVETVPGDPAASLPYAHERWER